MSVFADAMSQDLVLYWLAGLLEGEGAFVHGPPSSPTVPQLRIEMTDLDVVERVAAVFDRKVQRHRQRDPRHKPSFSTTVKGASAVHFMLLIRPVLGSRRQAQIDAAISGERALARTLGTSSGDMHGDRMLATRAHALALQAALRLVVEGASEGQGLALCPTRAAAP